MTGSADKHRAIQWGAQTMLPWFCSGCRRRHGAMVFKTQRLDGNLYCDRADENLRREEAARFSLAISAIYDTLKL
jgi:hypothetical protein